MAAAKSVLPASLKLTELKRLALLCGLPNSGTKADLTERIGHAAANMGVHRGGVRASDRRILSIDLGLRNLGYGLMTPASKPKSTAQEADPHAPPPINLHAWTRTDLVTPLSSTPASEMTEEEKLKEKQKQGEAFTPAALSKVAVKLVQHTLLPLNPTHVLIERQRFRSGNAAPVQEWTLRVNTLEAMIYAAFRTLRECGLWEGQIVPVPPKRVGPFWLDGAVGISLGKVEVAESDDFDDDDDEAAEQASKKRAARLAKLNMKKEKIAILGHWLEDGDVVFPQNQSVESIVETYLDHWKRAPGTRKKTTKRDGLSGDEEAIKKIDDLADCVLQGMAWMKWEENREFLKSSASVKKLLDD